MTVPLTSEFFDLNNDRERYLHTKLHYLLVQRGEMNAEIMKLERNGEREMADEMKSIMELSLIHI